MVYISLLAGFLSILVKTFCSHAFCSSWTKLLNELVCLKETFLKNGYPEDFINKCFKKFMDNINAVEKTTLTVEKKLLVLVLPYLSSISLQTKTKLKKSFKNILNCCKL